MWGRFTDIVLWLAISNVSSGINIVSFSRSVGIRTMEFTATIRGKLKLCLDGYAYVCDKKVQHKFYWKCERYGVCKGRVVTLYDADRGAHDLKSFKEHSHLPDSTRVEVLQANEEIKRVAATSASAPLQIVQVRLFMLVPVARFSPYIWPVSFVILNVSFRCSKYPARCHRRDGRL